MGREFFDEASEQSLVKITVVHKYFAIWASIMMRNLKKYGGDRIAYIDLFCGPGRYTDGTPSTPLIILEQAINDKEMSERLVTLFMDKESGHVESLSAEIGLLPDIQSLAHKPIVKMAEVSDALSSFFERHKIPPTLLFLDPWGYKGVTLRLIASVLKNWGCDCIVFFNYNRINAALDNPVSSEHMDRLFGQKRCDLLRKKLRGKRPSEREPIIVNEFCLALKEIKGEFVLPFCFKRADGERTSHYLVFVTKNELGYIKMKEVMAKCGSDRQQGVPTFQYTPASPEQQLLFQYNRPLDDLEDMLLAEFSGHRLQMKEIFHKHHVGKPYIEENYKEVLKKLEEKRMIIADPPVDKRPKRGGKPTFGDNVWVEFPPAGGWK